MNRLRLTAVLASLALHAAVIAPVSTGREPREPMAAVDLEPDDALASLDDEGELPIEELENTTFRVTLYEEPTPVAAAEAAVEAPPPDEAPPPEPAVAEAPVAEAEVVFALPVPNPPPEPLPPEPPPAEPPPPEPILTDAERAALAEMERGEATAEVAPLDDDDGEAHEVRDSREHRRSMARARPVARTGRPAHKPPCPPPVDDIARVADAHWYIDRDLVEFYATNMFELKKLGSVWTHKGSDGKLDGFRVGLARCSVLRQGGLRSGDVVHDINGRRIHSVIQAIAAYFALRSEPELEVRVTRRGEPLMLRYTIEQPQRKGRKAKKAATASR